MTDRMLVTTLDQVQFNKQIAAFEQRVHDDVAEVLAGQSEEVKKMVAEAFEEQRKSIVSAYLPSLKKPSKIKYMIAGTDGVMHERKTPQEAILANGKGRRMQLVLEWEGFAQ